MSPPRTGPFVGREMKPTVRNSHYYTSRMGLREGRPSQVPPDDMTSWWDAVSHGRHSDRAASAWPFRDGCDASHAAPGIDSRALAGASSAVSLVAGAKRRLVGERPVTLLKEFGHFVEWASLRAQSRRPIGTHPAGPRAASSASSPASTCWVLDDKPQPLQNAELRDILEILEDRSGTRSTVVTSQLPPKQWHDHVADPTLADAIRDRLLHNAHRFVLQGPSRRKKEEKLDS
jgi:hypothetical protein